MKKFPMSIKLVLLTFVLSFAVSSCGWHPSDEEIRSLEETRSAALDAEKSLQQKKSDTADLQQQVDQKKAELQKAKDENEKVVKAVAAKAEAEAK